MFRHLHHTNTDTYSVAQIHSLNLTNRLIDIHTLRHTKAQRSHKKEIHRYRFTQVEVLVHRDTNTDTHIFGHTQKDMCINLVPHTQKDDQRDSKRDKEKSQN